MKKIKECKKKKLFVKFPSMTFTFKISDKIKLNKGDIIRLNISSKLKMFAVVSVDQYEFGKNIDRVEVDEVDNIGESKIKEVFSL